MRTPAITQNMTLDGAIEMLGDRFDSQGQADVDNSDLIDEVQCQGSNADGLLVGRRTFEDMHGYWLHPTDAATGISDRLDRAQKYVDSSTMTDPQWQNSMVLSDDPRAGGQCTQRPTAPGHRGHRHGRPRRGKQWVDRQRARWERLFDAVDDYLDERKEQR